MQQKNRLTELNREIVLNDYRSAEKKNEELFLKGDVKACSQYIFDNQKFDAMEICNKFYETPIRVISIVKRTKVGMDGLMIEIAKNMATHPDDNFVLDRNNIFFITAMSNRSWEDEMKDKMPACFKDNVSHHAQLKKIKPKLKGIKNAIIINDEIDTGDKEDQQLHILLKDSGILDIQYMEKNNIRFVVVSATIVNELHELCKWGDKHYTHRMTIPPTYIGHKEFLERGIIKEYYPIDDTKSAERWITEDILDYYKTDFRVHIVRTDEKNNDYISDACKKHKITFTPHTSEERISHEELSKIFDKITNHVVIAVKGFYRRANLIPNEWKKKIGATHERYSKNYDTNVQVQGLPGRMTGYWKDDIIKGHKTGPHRTSIAAIKEYEKFYENLFAKGTYHRNGSKKIFLNPKNIKNLVAVDIKLNEQKVDPDSYRVYDDEKIVKHVCKILGYEYRVAKENSLGFKETSLNRKKEVVSLADAIAKVPSAYGTADEKRIWRTYYPCYVDTDDCDTLRFVVILRPGTDMNKVRSEIDAKYPSIKI